MSKASKIKKKAKAKKIVETPKYGVIVVHSCHSFVTREATQDRWDADDVAYDYTTEGVRPAKSEECGDIVIDFPIEQGGTYYLVSVTHTEGDSFHHETGHVAYVDLFKTKKEADDLALWIRKKYDGRNNPKSKKQSHDDEMNLRHNGKDYYVYQWSGYFNRLESVNVDQVHFIERN